MARFETVRDATRKFGTNSYLEVARKRLIDEKGGTSEFLVVTRGFFDEDGTKRWTRFVTMPGDRELVAWFADALTREGGEAAAPAASSGTEGERA